MAARKDASRSVTVRTISGHNVDIGNTFSRGIATDPSTPIAARLASRQPNTDRRRYLVTKGHKG